MTSLCEIKPLDTELLISLDDCIVPECQTTGTLFRDKHLWFYSIIVAIVAIIAAIIISRGVNSPAYIALVKPSWDLSPIIFTIMWIISYIFIAYVWYIADKKSEFSRFSRGTINILFALNLFLNITWIYLFFGAVNVPAALIIIIILLILTAVMLWYINKLDRIGAFLFTLYFIWLLFVLALNFVVYNPGTV